MRIKSNAMKLKINLTLDGALITRAKRYARKKGISVSALIESLLSGAVLKEEQRFSQRWQEKFKLAEKDSSRMQNLKERYFSSIFVIFSFLTENGIGCSCQIISIFPLTLSRR